MHPAILDDKTQKAEKANDFFKMEKFIWCFHKHDVLLLITGIFSQLIVGASIIVAVILTSQMLEIFAILDPVQQRNESYLYGSITFAVAVTSFASNLTSYYSFGLASARFTKRIRIKMFKTIIRQEISWYDDLDNRSSFLCTRLATVPQMCQGLTTDSVNILSRALSGIGVAFVVSIVLNWKMALLLLIFVIITFVAGIVHGNTLYSTKSGKESDTDRGGRLVIECSENIRTVASLAESNIL